MLRFPHISQCAELAMSIGANQRVSHAEASSTSQFHACFIVCFLSRKGILEPVRETAYWKETLSAFLPNSARSAELHLPPGRTGTIRENNTENRVFSI